MRISTILTIGIFLLFLSCVNESKKEVANDTTTDSEIHFYTTDSIQIFGDLYVQDKNGSTIILFHQGGSNARGEYGPILPRLMDKGFNILAIDQRVGGQYYGSYNRTLANIPNNSYGDGYGYCDAYNNLESALDYIIASGFSGKKLIWGSSYSASLAIQLAHQRQDDIDGVLAFSPASGGPMKDCLPDPYFATLKVPLIMLRPPNEMESENSKMQFRTANEYNHRTFVPQKAVHGSSMLVKNRVGADVEETWNVVFSFLDEIVAI